MRLSADDRWLLNAGAVGQSRDADCLARFAVLDVPAAGELWAEFRTVEYDVEECREALVRAGLPPTTYRFYSSQRERRGRGRRLARRLRRVASRLR